uniref:ATPase inhibitor, mitochondrial n=2 Tax=Oryzias melastigma TaxID=30732 RepID=A0A3B3D8S7_ORYME
MQCSTALWPGGGSSEPPHVLHVLVTNPHILLQIPADCLTHIRRVAGGGVARLSAWFQRRWSSRATMARLLLRTNLRRCLVSQTRLASDQLGELGGGAGKGGGGGGSVREAGGAFGKRAAVEEERYFRKKEMELLEVLRRHHSEEIEHHKKEIERLQKEIDRHVGKIRKLKHDD